MLTHSQCPWTQLTDPTIGGGVDTLWYVWGPRMPFHGWLAVVAVANPATETLVLGSFGPVEKRISLSRTDAGRLMIMRARWPNLTVAEMKPLICDPWLWGSARARGWPSPDWDYRSAVPSFPWATPWGTWIGRDTGPHTRHMPPQHWRLCGGSSGFPVRWPSALELTDLADDDDGIAPPAKRPTRTE
jgi:hypothetical protein